MGTLDQIKSLFKKYKECKKLEGDLLAKGVDKMIIDFAKSESKRAAKVNECFTSYDILFVVLTYIAIEHLLDKKVSPGDVMKFVYSHYNIQKQIF